MEPVARSSERCGARSKPFLMMSERIVIYDLRLAIYEFNIGLQYSCTRARCHAIANLTAKLLLAESVTGASLGAVTDAELKL
jgi:hypothetical protein